MNCKCKFCVTHKQTMGMKRKIVQIFKSGKFSIKLKAEINLKKKTSWELYFSFYCHIGFECERDRSVWNLVWKIHQQYYQELFEFRFKVRKENEWSRRKVSNGGSGWKETGKQEMLIYFVEVFFSFAGNDTADWMVHTQRQREREGASADADKTVAIDMENISFSKTRVGGTTHDNIKVNISRKK